MGAIQALIKKGKFCWISLSVFGFVGLYKFRKFWMVPILKRIGMVLTYYTLLYRKDYRPKKIILVRHGESQANLDNSLYQTIPDNKIKLSEGGINQAKQAGAKLKDLVQEGSIKYYISPFERTRQTFEIISGILKFNKFEVQQDPRLREQEWGNLQKDEDSIWKERRKVGKFFYRFATGESGADVYDRASMFLESIFRDIDLMDREKYDNYIIITHGLFMRMFLMRFFKWTIEKFDTIVNPKNCEMWVFEKNQFGKYELMTPVFEKN